MKSKKDNYFKQVKVHQNSLKELKLDLQAIQEEHDKYVLDSSIGKNWFDSLPIETLKESLDNEKRNPRTKYSLKDMRHKFSLQRLYDKKKEQLDLEQSKLNIARIDYIINQIEKVSLQ